MAVLKVVFEGEKLNIKKLLDWCRDSPKDAIVRNIEIVNEHIKMNFRVFKLLTTV